MMKKMLFVGGGLLLLAGLFFGRALPSYVSTAWSRTHQVVRDNTPVSFDLDRLRGMVKALDPQIHHNEYVIAHEEIQISRLASEIAKSEELLAKDKADILRLKADLESGSENFVYSGHSYSADQVKNDLKNRFLKFETNEATLKSNKEILAARESGLKAAIEQNKEVRAQRVQLEAEIASLDARQKSVEVAQTASKINLDDSQLARVRELLDDVKAKIEVKEKLVHTTTTTGQIQLDPVVDENISDRIAKKFGLESSPAASVATKNEK